MVRIACLDAIVPGNTLTEKSRNLAAWGFDGIEVFLDLALDLDTQMAELRMLHARTGVSPCALSLPAPLAETEPGRDASISSLAGTDLVRKAIELSSELRVPTITVFEYRPREVLPWCNPYQPAPQSVRSEFVDALGSLASMAESCDGLLLLEPINRYESRYVNTLAETVSLAEEVGSKHLAVMADLFHMSIEEPDMARSIVDAGAWIRHVHLADSNRLLPGYGHTDFRAVFRALKNVGFRGYMSLECYVTGARQAELPKCAARLSKYWEDA